MMILFLVGVMLAVLFYAYAMCSFFLVQEVRDRKIQSKLKRKALFILSVTPIANFLVFIGFALEFCYRITRDSIIEVIHEVEED